MGAEGYQPNSGEDASRSSDIVRLIPDLPTKDDAFGGHKLLADALADLVRREEGGKAIALEGGWGSGKSSVIEMLKFRLEGAKPKDSAIRVHVFDAWSHEGDPLRRVFLEDLTEFCSERFGRQAQEDWARRLKTEITGRTRTTDQTTTPVLRSSWPLLVLALIAVFPVAVAVINGLASQDLSEGSITALIISAVVVALLVPTGLLLLFGYCQWPWWPKFCKQHATKQKRKEAAGRFISLYDKRIDDTVTTTAHETFGPTSIEFQQYFSDLVSEHLQDGTRKLVIVLDNLDRVPVRTARALWSTLRVFAECCENACNAEWAKRTWFIVPYDPSAAKRLWDDEDDEDADRPKADQASTTQYAQQSNEDSESKAVQPKAPRLSAAFLDKTFQIRFDVPPLLLADWQPYLHEQLTQAMPDAALQPEAIHRVYLLSRLMAQVKKRPPTPRHLKLYVNDIAALHRRYGSAFPIDHLALYAILRRQGHDVRLWLLECTSEHTRYESIFGGRGFVGTLCAMAHGITDVNRAQDLHLRSPIESALADGDAEELERLSAMDGFWPVLEMICDDAIISVGTDEVTVVNTLSAVDGAGLLSEPRPESHALKQFLVRMLNEAEWKELTTTTADAVTTSVKLELDTAAVQTCIDQMASIDKDDDATVDATQWLEGMQAMAASFRKEDALERFSSQVRLPATEKITPVLVALANTKPTARRNIACLLTVEGDIEQLVSTFLPQPNAEWAEEKSLALRAALSIPSVKLDISNILSSLHARFAVDAEFNPREVQWFVDAYRDLEAFHPNATAEHIHRFVKSGVVFRRIHNFQKQIGSERGATLLRWAIYCHHFAKPPGGPNNAPAGFELAKQTINNTDSEPSVANHVANYCRQHDDEGLFESVVAETDQLRPFVISVVSQLRKDGALGGVCTAEVFASQFVTLKKLCDGKEVPVLDELITELLADEAFVASLSQLELTEDSSLEGIAYLVRQNATQRSDQFANRVKEYLTDRSADQWKQSLLSPDNALQLLAAIRGVEADFHLSQAFAEAFESYLNELLDGSIEGNEIPNGWALVHTALPSHTQQTIAARVIERADKTDTRPLEIVRVFADRLREAAQAHSEESFVRNVISPLLNSREQTAIDWIAGVLGGDPKFWSNAPDSDRETFEQEVQTIYTEVDDSGAQEGLRRIAEAAQISLTSEGVNDEDADEGGDMESASKDE